MIKVWLRGKDAPLLCTRIDAGDYGIIYLTWWTDEQCGLLAVHGGDVWRVEFV